MKLFNNKEEQNRGLTKEEKNYIKKYVRENYNFGRGCQSKESLENLYSSETEEFKNFVIAIFIMLYEDYKKNKTDTSVKDDISYLGQGFFSSAFKVGNNVVKMGLTTTSVIEEDIDSLSALKVLFKKKIKLGENTYGFISILPYVKTMDFSDEDVYQVFKGLRDSGYIWNDPTPENIGILQENYVSNFNGKTYNSLKEGQMPGDLVVIDLDDMCNLNKYSKEELVWVADDITYGSYNGKVYRFEKRYEEETQTDIRIL